MAIVIDAKNLIVGRVAAFAAKQVLLGETVDIVNCEQAIISGDRKEIISRYKHRDSLGGPHWGPFMPKMADRYMRRVVRGMLPHKKARGREAFKRIMCWLGMPDQFKNTKPETLKGADADKLQNASYIRLSELMDLLKHRK
jgi:large subunit ribosomal protein L13